MTSLVVADTGPLRYLAEIGHLDLLPRMFGTVCIPDVVHRELGHESTPLEVRKQIQNVGVWLQVQVVESEEIDAYPQLDAGEAAAITLALATGADLVLMDDRRGVAVVRQLGIEATGTLGILLRASHDGMIDLAESIAALRRSSFRCSPALFAAVLQHNRQSH